jgi:hypothetical protein
VEHIKHGANAKAINIMICELLAEIWSFHEVPKKTDGASV